MIVVFMVTCFRGKETHGFYVLSILGATRLVRAFHFSHVIEKRSRSFLDFTWLGGFSVSVSERERSTEEAPILIQCSQRAQNTADGQVAKGESEVGVHLELGANYTKLLLLAPPNQSTAQKAVRSLTTNIRIFVRGRVARNPAVLQPGLIGPFVCILRLPRPHNPPTSLLVRDHLSIPRLPQELLVALTERCPGPSQPLAAADGARSRKRSVVTRADAPSVEVPRAVRHGGRPLPNDGPQLVVIKVLEAATLAARCGYVLRRRL